MPHPRFSDPVWLRSCFLPWPGTHLALQELLARKFFKKPEILFIDVCAKDGEDFYPCRLDCENKVEEHGGPFMREFAQFLRVSRCAEHMYREELKYLSHRLALLLRRTLVQTTRSGARSRRSSRC